MCLRKTEKCVCQRARASHLSRLIVRLREPLRSSRCSRGHSFIMFQKVSSIFTAVLLAMTTGTSLQKKTNTEPLDQSETEGTFDGYIRTCWMSGIQIRFNTNDEKLQCRTYSVTLSIHHFLSRLVFLSSCRRLYHHPTPHCAGWLQTSLCLVDASNGPLLCQSKQIHSAIIPHQCSSVY